MGLRVGVSSCADLRDVQDEGDSNEYSNCAIICQHPVLVLHVLGQVKDVVKMETRAVSVFFPSSKACAFERIMKGHLVQPDSTQLPLPTAGLGRSLVQANAPGFAGVKL